MMTMMKLLLMLLLVLPMLKTAATERLGEGSSHANSLPDGSAMENEGHDTSLSPVPSNNLDLSQTRGKKQEEMSPLLKKRVTAAVRNIVRF